MIHNGNEYAVAPVGHSVHAKETYEKGKRLLSLIRYVDQKWIICHAPPPPTSISKPKKVHKFQFQASGILLFTLVQRLLYGPEISQYLPGMLQFMNLWAWCKNGTRTPGPGTPSTFKSGTRDPPNLSLMNSFYWE